MIQAPAVLSAYDGVTCESLRTMARASRVVAVEYCASTMDLAHQLASDGAAHGTVVVAEEQGAGRGRSGNAWRSLRGAGVWTSVLLRPSAGTPGALLSLRVGLALADALDAHSAAPIQLKWPNDLFLTARKLGGVLVEARWRGDLLEWLVVGVGINVRDSDLTPPSAALGAGVSRAVVLVDIVRAVLSAGHRDGTLTAEELSRFARRDIAAGREATAPLEGIVLGINERGELRVRTTDGDRVAVAGSLVFSHPLAE